MQRIRKTALAVVLALTLFVFPGSFVSHAANGTLGISNRTPKIGDTVTVTVNADSAPTLQYTSKILSADSVSGGAVSGNSINFSSTNGSVTFTVKNSGEAELILKAGGEKVSSATVSTSNSQSDIAEDTPEEKPDENNTPEETDTEPAALDDDLDNPDNTDTDSNENNANAGQPDVASYSVTADSVAGSNGMTVSVIAPTQIPSCFAEATLPDAAASPIVYQFAGFPNTFYYFYGTNDTYGDGWYECDVTTGILSKANTELINAYDSLERSDINDTAANTSGASKDKGFSISALKEKWNSLNATNKIMFIIAIAVIIIIIIIVINIIAASREKSKNEDDDSDSENDEHEDIKDSENDSDEDEEEDEDNDELNIRKKKAQEKKLAKKEEKLKKKLLKEQKRAEKENKYDDELELLDFGDDEDIPDKAYKESEDDDENDESNDSKSEDEKAVSSKKEYKPDNTQILPSVKDIREKLKEDEANGKENPYIKNYTEVSEGSEIRTGDNSKYNDDAARHALFMARKNFYNEERLGENNSDQQLNSRYVRSVKSVKTVQKEEEKAKEEKEFEDKMLYPLLDDGEQVVEPEEKNIFVPKDMILKQKKKKEISSDYNIMTPEDLEDSKEGEASSNSSDEKNKNSVPATGENRKNKKKNGGKGGSSGSSESSDIDVIDFNDL